MRQAEVHVDKIPAGILTEHSPQRYCFEYYAHYQGPPVSLTMPVTQQTFDYAQFPAFFDGVLPEGILLAALLRMDKLDADDYLGQLLAVGKDLVGNVTVHAYQPS